MMLMSGMSRLANTTGNVMSDTVASATRHAWCSMLITAASLGLHVDT